MPKTNGYGFPSRGYFRATWAEKKTRAKMSVICHVESLGDVWQYVSVESECASKQSLGKFRMHAGMRNNIDLIHMYVLLNNSIYNCMSCPDKLENFHL